MPSLLIMGAKGGVGTSLFSVNLAILLARRETCVLLDLSALVGGDDLLLNLNAKRSWQDLLPVSAELEARQLSLAAVRHESGLSLIAAPDIPLQEDLGTLVEGISLHAKWLVIDGEAGWTAAQTSLAGRVDAIVLVATPDPPSLRACARMTHLMEVDNLSWLVLSQWTPAHPTAPDAIAESLGMSLLATLPPAAASVGEHVDFGRPAVVAADSRYTRALHGAAEQLRRDLHVSGD